MCRHSFGDDVRHNCQDIEENRCFSNGGTNLHIHSIAQGRPEDNQVEFLQGPHGIVNRPKNLVLNNIRRFTQMANGLLGKNLRRRMHCYKCHKMFRIHISVQFSSSEHTSSSGHCCPDVFCKIDACPPPLCLLLPITIFVCHLSSFMIFVLEAFIASL